MEIHLKGIDTNTPTYSGVIIHRNVAILKGLFEIESLSHFAIGPLDALPQMTR